MKYKFQYAHPNVKKVFSVYPVLDTSMLSQGVDAPHIIAESGLKFFLIQILKEMHYLRLELV